MVKVIQVYLQVDGRTMLFVFPSYQLRRRYMLIFTLAANHLKFISNCTNSEWGGIKLTQFDEITHIFPTAVRKKNKSFDKRSFK